MLIRIMACKEREDNVNKMLSSLGDNAEVIRDEKHDACDTLCRMLNSNESMLVMEDDIELCQNFLEKAKKEIEQRPDTFIMFYSFGPGEIGKGVSWRTTFAYTQCYYVPEGLGKKMAEFLKDNYWANNRRYSRGIGAFLTQEGVKRHLVIPSLVQHLNLGSILEPDSIRGNHHSKFYKYN